jgi:energy-coupling factor transporter ATP-binding protein EcfA2
MSDRYDDPYWHITSFAISYATDVALEGPQNVKEPEYETRTVTDILISEESQKALKGKKSNQKALKGKKSKAEKALAEILKHSFRWGGVIAGPPGSGKTTFMKALQNVALTMGLQVIYVAKDYNCNKGPHITVDTAQEVIQHLDTVLHYVADSSDIRIETLKHLVADTARKIGTLDIGVLTKRVEEKLGHDLSLMARVWLENIQMFIKGNSVLIPRCVQGFKEIALRLIPGIIVAIRHRTNLPVMLDDIFGFIFGDERSHRWFATYARPFIISINRYLDTEELLGFNPVVIPPGGQGGIYRISSPNRYLVLFDSHRFEIDAREIEKLAEERT